MALEQELIAQNDPQNGALIMANKVTKLSALEITCGFAILYILISYYVTLRANLGQTELVAEVNTVADRF